MSKLSRFFLNEIPDNKGRYLDAMLDEDYNWIEGTHDFVQWWFPNTMPSNFNPDAPLLTVEDIAEVMSNVDCKIAFMSCTSKMLGFFGIEYKNGVASKASDFDERQYTLYGEFNHNHLRFTRVLLAMYYFGFGKAAKNVCDFVVANATEKSSIGFWQSAVNDGSLVK